jgi:hypothetical protein
VLQFNPYVTNIGKHQQFPARPDAMQYLAFSPKRLSDLLKDGLKTGFLAIDLTFNLRLIFLRPKKC